MKDINGGELREGGMAMLLCEVLATNEDHVHVRVMNSDLEITVGVKYDEVLGGLVADSELTAFEEQSPFDGQTALFGAATNAFARNLDRELTALADVADDQADGVKTWPME